MGTFATRLFTSALLLANAFLAVKFMYRSRSATEELVPFTYRVRQSGSYPDGVPVRQNYTGIPAIDLRLAAFAALFGLLVDGKDPATHSFALWFLPQMLPLLVFMFWEGGKARSIFARL